MTSDAIISNKTASVTSISWGYDPLKVEVDFSKTIWDETSPKIHPREVSKLLDKFILDGMTIQEAGFIMIALRMMKFVKTGKYPEIT